MIRLTRSLIALSATVCLVAPLGTAVSTMAAPAARSDSRVVLGDAAEDVYVYDLDAGQYVLAGAFAPADVRRAEARHGDRKITVKLTFADLRKSGIQNYYVRFRTPTMERFAEVHTGAGDWGGTVVWKNEKGAELATKGLSHKVDYADDFVRLTVARSALDRPTWVRLVMMNQMWDLEDQGSSEYIDNPHNDEALPFWEYEGDSAPWTKRIYKP